MKHYIDITDTAFEQAKNWTPLALVAQIPAHPVAPQEGTEFAGQEKPPAKTGEFPTEGTVETCRKSEKVEAQGLEP